MMVSDREMGVLVEVKLQKNREESEREWKEERERERRDAKMRKKKSGLAF